MEEKKLTIKDRILKRKKLIITIVLILIAGFVAWKYFIDKKNGDVEIATIKRGDVAEELILSGEVKADEYAQLKFPASGKVAWIGATEGDTVYKGQALTSMDRTNLNSSLQIARSNLRSKEATLERTHDDVKDNDEAEPFDIKETRTAAEVAKDNAYEAVLIAEENMRNATLYAPFAGLVSFVANSFSGVNMLFSEIQVEVINPETIYFEVVADQSEVIDLHKGQKVNIVLDSFPEDEIKGEVVFISLTPKVNEVGTVYKVRVNLVGDVLDQKSRIGMTGDAKFILSESEDVLYVPPKFVNSDKEGKYVNLSSKNNKVYVEQGVENEDMVEISGDIKEGDTVYD